MTESKMTHRDRFHPRRRRGLDQDADRDSPDARRPTSSAKSRITAKRCVFCRSTRSAKPRFWSGYGRVPVLFAAKRAAVRSMPSPAGSKTSTPRGLRAPRSHGRSPLKTRFARTHIHRVDDARPVNRTHAFLSRRLFGRGSCWMRGAVDEDEDTVAVEIALSTLVRRWWMTVRCPIPKHCFCCRPCVCAGPICFDFSGPGIAANRRESLTRAAIVSASEGAIMRVRISSRISGCSLDHA